MTNAANYSITFDQYCKVRVDAFNAAAGQDRAAAQQVIDQTYPLYAQQLADHLADLAHEEWLEDQAESEDSEPFPAATEQVKTRVATFRDAMHYAEYSLLALQAGSCRKWEVPTERRNGLLSLFRAMRELQAMHCPRANQTDRDRYERVLTRATQAVQEHAAQYFEGPITVLMSDEEIKAQLRPEASQARPMLSIVR